MPLRVLAVTSWGNACGIADYADQLQRALSRIGAPIQLFPNAATLDPAVGVAYGPHNIHLVWLNHHAALHARWTPEHIQQLQAKGIPVVATIHDTKAGEEGSHNDPQLLGIWWQADATVVHEPVADMPGVHVIRHGIPPAAPPHQYGTFSVGTPDCFKQYHEQPVMGTVGFNFPWKNYDRLCQVCRDAGWAQVILSNDANQADEVRWRGINPWIQVVRKFLPQEQAISYLTGCDATAFCYECANNGTSGAIRQGIAARKPVYAFQGCRQFRDLLIAEATEEPSQYIRWVRDFAHLKVALKTCDLPKVDVGMVYLATRDSWDRQAACYAEIFERAGHTATQLREIGL